jgi:undecaprenyl-diphosphatase
LFTEDRRMLSRATGWAKSGFAVVRRLEPMVLAALLVVVGGVWAFVELADELIEEDTGDFDGAVAAFLRDGIRPRGPTWLAHAARDVTALGSGTVLSATVVLVCGALAMARRFRQAAFVGAASATGLLVGWLLKQAFQRARPETPAALELATWSFPSGHSFNSAVVYLTLGALLARFTERWSLRVYVFTVGLATTVLVGVTRVYLGYHYATDVLAGWAGGLAWALLCVLAAEAIGRRAGRRGPDALARPANR